MEASGSGEGVIISLLAYYLYLPCRASILSGEREMPHAALSCLFILGRTTSMHSADVPMLLGGGRNGGGWEGGNGFHDQL